MGASNFSRPNASKVFAVLMSEEVNYSKCNECGDKYFEYDEEYICSEGEACSCGSTDIVHGEEYKCPECFEVDDFFDYLKDTVEQEVNTVEENYRWRWNECSSRKRDLNNLFYLQSDKSFGDVNIDLRVYGTIEFGYHEGAMLDWRIECNDEDNIGCLRNEFYNSDMSIGLQTIQSNNAQKWAEKEVEAMIALVEKVYTEVSTPLVEVARFSNGETMYSKV